MLLLRVCMAYSIDPLRLDDLIDRDPGLVEDMVEAMLIEREEADRRAESLAAIGAMRRR